MLARSCFYFLFVSAFQVFREKTSCRLLVSFWIKKWWKNSRQLKFQLNFPTKSNKCHAVNDVTGQLIILLKLWNDNLFYRGRNFQAFWRNLLQWLWPNWFSGRFRHQKSVVRIQSWVMLFSFNCIKSGLKRQNKEKRGREWPNL